MQSSSRRDFLAAATAFGASLAFARAEAKPSRIAWTENRAAYPEGVASGDPHPDSVILWTRRPGWARRDALVLTLEVAEDEAFKRVVATARARPSADNDWTCRVLAARLKPSTTYFYRFTDPSGAGSRIGRTRTAPAAEDDRDVRFTFVSCQSPNESALNAWRKMIFEDERKPAAEQLDFVLHLGDFIYEVVVYPEDQGNGRYGRRVRELVRYPDGEKISNFYMPTTLRDYRLCWQAFLRDPDIQDARARWPFVCMWDNHEFSWQGHQAIQVFGGKARPNAPLKVWANQAWFEHIPARVVRAPDGGRDVFVGPDVKVAPVETYGEDGLAQEPNNLAAINSLKVFRALKFGKRLDLLLTDNHSFQTPAVGADPRVGPAFSDDYYVETDEEALAILDAGRAYNGGHPPEIIRFGDKETPNWRKDKPTQSMLGSEQKAWFLDRLGSSRATWKVWGNSLASLAWRGDPQNAPVPEHKWPGAGYGMQTTSDWAGFISERTEILDLVRTRGVTGFGTVCGDRHAFFAGLLAPVLPPKGFEPVGFEFVTGSLSSVGQGLVMPRIIPKGHPLRPAYVYDPPNGGPARSMVDFTVLHGYRAAFRLQETHDRAKALELHNPELSPHLKFVDGGGHGYGLVTCGPDALTCEFVCIPDPNESAGPDGGPVLYRVNHRVPLWRAGEPPSLEQTVLEGDVSFHT